MGINLDVSKLLANKVHLGLTAGHIVRLDECRAFTVRPAWDYWRRGAVLCGRTSSERANARCVRGDMLSLLSSLAPR